MLENQISKAVVNAAYEVHVNLGPGLLESAYENALIYELQKAGLYVEKQVELPLKYKNIEMECGYRIDLWVERDVILELKTVQKFEPIHTTQLLTYLKLTDNKLGLLINFNSTLIKNGIKRVVNNHLKSTAKTLSNINFFLLS
ncbi:GxxExxY protein [Marivirga harenae]|uniref:GxxExxY protein n=1 Tax=Marivirga harenae TaxID=2010992 RepID=UPI0026DF0096|nr:GxxExxY protein [Marivirga harenae]WKV10563.1 GxxExxY protein [Marivirga harenae]